jgi:hypothetical protein
VILGEKNKEVSVPFFSDNEWLASIPRPRKTQVFPIFLLTPTKPSFRKHFQFFFAPLQLISQKFIIR